MKVLVSKNTILHKYMEDIYAQLFSMRGGVHLEQPGSDSVEHLRYIPVLECAQALMGPPERG